MANEPSRGTQYFAAIGATMGGFCLGTVIGWSSPAESLLREKFPKDPAAITWISSIMTLGAAAAQLYMAITLDIFGRRRSMLINAIPFIIGWLILAFANNSIPMYITGRFITGFCGGSFCVAAPAYIGEMADKDIRGTLGVFFQLLLVIGILLSYTLGIFKNIFVLSVVPIVGPITLMIIFIFLPESPVYLYKKGNVEKAQKAMQFFRGPNYDISSEMKEIDQYVKTKDSFWEKFKTRASIKAFIMLLVMNAVQQLSGINAVMFFAHKIFEWAGSKISENNSAIILGLVQVAITFVPAYLIDRSGRKLLWVVSLTIMGACLVVLGIYFEIKHRKPETANKIGIVPLLALCIYIAGFSLATGPLPWVMLAEFLPNAVKEHVGSFAACFNWLLAFCITRSFQHLVDTFRAAPVFFFYALVCGAGLVFVVLFLIETKNKTLEEIQTELGTPPT